MDQATRRDGQAVRVTNPSLQLVAYYRFAKISLHSRSCATSISTLRIRIAHATWPSMRCGGAPTCTCRCVDVCVCVCVYDTYVCRYSAREKGGSTSGCVRRLSRGGKRAASLSFSLSLCQGCSPRGWRHLPPNGSRESQSFKHINTRIHSRRRATCSAIIPTGISELLRAYMRFLL
ncbi:unnamed protein product [Lasius platythorax]|uniref:Uncharacterized protein n=1 Tax=Lasius platythorax TaxID=488582 RepID=A0AAV2NPN4_9HYME